jgi:chromosome segregation ATPase
LRLFNKYLKRKIEKERKDNERLEETFQNIKKITGITNVKNIVEKIGNKDKDYNHCVANVNDKEIRISILREQIKKLNQDFIMLKNEASVDISEADKVEENKIKYDEEEQELIQREQELIDELEELNNKNTTVELTFEKVTENIKVLIGKSEPLQKLLDPNNNEVSKNERTLNTEEEVFNSYVDFLEVMRDVVDKFIINVFVI